MSKVPSRWFENKIRSDNEVSVALHRLNGRGPVMRFDERSRSCSIFNLLKFSGIWPDMMLLDKVSLFRE